MDKKPNEILDVQPKILIEISAGEFCDRLTILRIKIRKWYETRAMRTQKDYAKLNNLSVELKALEEAGSGVLATTFRADIANLVHTLGNINEQLWDAEDKLRLRETRFAGTPLLDTPEFVELARSVYKLNDQRHLLKNELTRMLGGSPEVKMLPEYKELTDARERLAESLGQRPPRCEPAADSSQPRSQ